MSERWIKGILTIVGGAVLIAFCLAPFLYMLVVSLTATPEVIGGSDGMQLTTRAYTAVLTGTALHFLSYFANSLIVSSVSAAITVIVASLAAYALTRLALPGKMALLLGVLVVAMFPQIGIVGYLYKLMTALGWINTYQALILPYVAWTLPISLWILTGYFSQLPVELDKAAVVDGATRLQVLRKVILPVAAPGVLSVYLLAFISAFNEFMFALMLTTDHQARTVPVAISTFQGLHGETPWGEIMAASVITTLPVVVLTLIFQRQIIRGLTQGAVKG